MIDTEVRPRRAQRAELPTKGDQRERALLGAAGRLLEAGSFADASVAQIATEAGLSRANFYFYFASKQALLATLLDAAVSHFNLQIEQVVRNAGEVSPDSALRATVQAAAELWWDNSTVLIASVQLGAAMPEVYERTRTNMAIVAEPTVGLLRQHGRVAESRDDSAATGIVMALMLMSERSFFDLMRGTPTIAERDALTATLQTIWLRAFGLAE